LCLTFFFEKILHARYKHEKETPHEVTKAPTVPPWLDLTGFIVMNELSDVLLESVMKTNEKESLEGVEKKVLPCPNKFVLLGFYK
jgi:hypothetical protein